LLLPQEEEEEEEISILELMTRRVHPAGVGRVFVMVYEHEMRSDP